MGGGSYLSIARIAAFFLCVWCGSMASKKAGISTIVAEIVIGLALGPKILGVMPNEYAMCAYEDTDHMEGNTGRMNCELLKDGQYHHIRGHDDLEHMVEEELEFCKEKIADEESDFYGKSFEECLLQKCDEHLLHECAATPDIFTIIGHIGVSMMIFEAGMHVDFEKVKMVGPKACCVAVIGTFMPIILGTVLIGLFGYDFYPNGTAVGISLSPTSIGISLKLLGEMGVLDRLFGQAIIVAAVVDDILALICYQLFFAVASADGGLGASLGKLSAGVVLMAICAALSIKHWPMFMDWMLRDKSSKGKFSPKAQLHFFMMFFVLLVYATGFNFVGSHLWGCFVGGLSFTAVPDSHHLWVHQTKRSVKWMIRIFFACTVGFSIPIEKLLSAKSFGYGMVIGAIPCLAAKVFCAPFMGDAKWVIGWGMCGRAEFAYYIAAAAMSAMLMSKEVYAITIWALLCATVVAPFAFRGVLQRYTKMLDKKHRSTFMTLPEGVKLDFEHAPSDRASMETPEEPGTASTKAPEDHVAPSEFNESEKATPEKAQV
jgi:Kef-type K+ transport system membrane component KefB